MSGFGHDTATVWLTIELGDGHDPVIVTGRDDGVNGFTWSAKQGEATLTITCDREVLIDGITPEDDDDDCDCSTFVAGALWPMASDGDDAAEAIAEKIGGTVEWAPLPHHEEHHPGGGLHPFVMPTDFPLPADHPLRGDTP